MAGNKEKTTGRRAFKIYITILVVTIVLAFMALNAFLSLAESRYDLKADLTAHRIYSLSEESENVLHDLEEDVEIYTLYPAGGDDPEVSLLLEKYAAANPHIHVANVDPEQNPAFVSQFAPNGETISGYSVIITDTAHERYRVYSLTDLKIYVGGSDGRAVKVGSKAEQKITSALYYLESGIMNRAVFIQGHGEVNPNTCAQMLTILDGQNYDLLTYDYLQKREEIDPSTDTLFFIGPGSDISDDEYEVYKDFFEAGGRAIVYVGNVSIDEMTKAVTTNMERFPNLDLLLKSYDMEVNKDYVLGGETADAYQSANSLVCSLAEHAITEPILESGRSVIITNAGSIQFNTLASRGVTTTPLVYTSPTCYAKNLTPDQSSLEFAPGDASGPFVLGALAENDSNGSKLMLFTSSDMVRDTEIQRSGNTDLFLNTISYLNERHESIVIAQKQTIGEVLQFTSDRQVYATVFVTVAVVPVVLLVIGFVIWKKRKGR